MVRQRPKGAGLQPTHSASASTSHNTPPIPFLPADALPNGGITAAMRYAQNIKVIRRRDPSITSVFDQFPYICLFQQQQKADGSGSSWEKKGCEGSMFVFEKSNGEYGLYILNRAGAQDFAYTFKQTDAVKEWGKLTVIVPNKDVTSMFGLWQEDTGSRESLFAVIQRVHKSICEGTTYPMEYRYGPENPPPSKIYSPAPPTDGPQSHSRQASHNTYTRSVTGYEASDESGYEDEPRSSTNGGMGTSINALFARLGPVTTPSPELHRASPSSFRFPAESPPPVQPSGMALLNSIFASATPTPPPPPPPLPPSSSSYQPPHAPQPQHFLRPPSVATSSTTSTSSHSSSYESLQPIPAVDGEATPHPPHRTLARFHAQSDDLFPPVPPMPPKSTIFNEDEEDIAVLDFSDSRGLAAQFSGQPLDAEEHPYPRKSRQNPNRKKRERNRRETITPNGPGSVQILTPSEKATPKMKTVGSPTVGSPTPPKVASKNASFEDAAFAAVSATLRGEIQPGLSRTDFMSQLMGLIYGNSAFVDRLYDAYLRS